MLANESHHRSAATLGFCSTWKAALWPLAVRLRV